jgi:hypothetical protein
MERTCFKTASGAAGGVGVGVGLAFEYLRQYGTFQQRVALIMGVAIASAVWHTSELWRLHRREPSFPVRLMLSFSVIYFVFANLCWLVMVFSNDPTHINLYNEEMMAFATRWGQTAWVWVCGSAAR